MPTPQVHSAAARSNPRRRQRNASEDSVAIRQPVKRRKRSALTKETFAETSEKVNGSLEHVEDAPLLNGSAHEPSSMRNNKNGPSNNLAIRHGLSKKSESQWRSERSGNDIELTKNDNYIVTQLPTTPDVLSRLLKEEPWRAELSPQLGCAIAMTHVSALIWRYTQSPGSSELIEPMQIRLLDPIASPHQPLPMGVLVPTSAEPALLVLMPTTGKVTYWEALSYAANSDLSRQRQSSIQGVVGGMMSGEQIVAVTEAEPRGFVLTLNTGRLAHLAIKDTQGRLSIEVHYLRSAAAQPKGIFGSIRGVLSTAGWKKDLAAVKAGRSVRRGQRYMVVATNEGTFQVWDLHWNGTHTLAYEVDAKVDLLRESLKGVRNTQALHEYPFKVLDFSLLPHGSHGRDVAKTYTSGDCRLLVLTALKDPQVSKYTLIGLTLADGKGTVDVVHQITCYTSHIPADPQFRPQIMVPEPAQTAIIAFEKSLVLLSLVEVDETPSSQLQMEAHTLPIPFQDAVAFRQDKSCYTIACAAEALDRDRQRSICSFLIHGYGMIRISTQPTKAGQSPVSRAAITAQTKIEQAVFFGSHNQNLIDFSPRSETRFSSLDIEAASLNISQAIANSTTPYLARLEPNMQRSLTKRAAALDNLIRYLREHHSRSLSPQCRWKLLWTAEKMAAAQAIWQWYNNILSDPRTKQRDLFAELIESMPDTAKLENQPDTGESDGVRHWFVHDVWRLEWIIPYAHEIIELLFRESVEDKTQLDNLTKAHMIGDAVDIQSGTMEAAFQFRELNADLYGFDKNRISDGILRAADDFENIDEFWTSAALGADTPLVLERVRELTELPRAMAKVLASDVDDILETQEEEGPSNEEQEKFANDIHTAMLRLAQSSPRQIHMCCQTYVERARWLKSRKTAKEHRDGEEILKIHRKIRKHQFVDLTELNLSDEAIALAEKYDDMEALLDILEQESLNGHDIEPSLPVRINQYFDKFGTQWANEYFSRSLKDGKIAVETLNNNSNYKKFLTDFLRSHSGYANVTWINEVATERDYFSASTYLEQSAKHTDDLWSQKVMLSLGKLSVQAAEGKDQTRQYAAGPMIQRLDQHVTLLKMQDSLHDFFKPYIKTAIDSEAAVDVVMENFGKRSVEGKPLLKQQLRSNLSHLFGRVTIRSSDLINVLTVMDNDTEQGVTNHFLHHRFFLSLNIARLLSAISHIPLSSPASSLRSSMIWRRILISSDWTEFNRTELKNDDQVTSETRTTPLFQTLLEGHRNRYGTEEEESFWDILPPPRTPSELLSAGTDPAELRSLPEYATQSDSILVKLARELRGEAKILERHIEKGRLEEWYKGVLEAAGSSYRDEIDQQGEEEAEKVRLSSTFIHDMTRQDREKYLLHGTIPEGFEEVMPSP